MTLSEETRYQTVHTLGIHLETGHTGEANLCGQVMKHGWYTDSHQQVTMTQQDLKHTYDHLA